MGVFHVFLNCTNGTKSPNTSQVINEIDPNEQLIILSFIASK